MKFEQLLDIRAIEQLKYRYMRAADTKDWDLMRTCFAEDASVSYSSGLYAYEGREAILGFLSSVLTPSFISSHIALHPEITLSTSNTAVGVWRMQDIVHCTGPNATAKESDFHGGEEMVGAGYYYDDYIKNNDSWLIKRTGYVRIFEKISSPDERPGFHLVVEPKMGVR